MRLLALLFIVALVSCATPAEMRSQPPVFETQSSLPSKAIAICIADKWENSGFLGLTVPVHMRQITNGYTVSVRDAYNTTYLFVDIEDSGAGSKTRFYRSLNYGATDFIELTKACQK